MSTKTIIDCTDGSVTVVDLTPEEISEMEQRQADFEAQQAEIAAEEAAKTALKESAKAKLVAGEPLTEEEAATLVL